jgi:guanylate kinase
MIQTDEDDEFDRILRENNMKGQAYHFSPQRTWTGLTEQEQGAIMEDLNAYGTNLYQFAQAIEAKLKERNT